MNISEEEAATIVDLIAVVYNEGLLDESASLLLFRIEQEFPSAVRGCKWLLDSLRK